MAGQKQIVVGSRGSRLALWQTDFIIRRLASLHPTLAIRTEVIKTEGDHSTDKALVDLGERGVFVKEIETALLAGEIDFAVHSLKDLPVVEPPGLTLAAIPAREDARDVVVSRHGLGLAALPSRACVGTSSPRRAAQLLAARPDLVPVGLRGNVDTRLRRAQTADYDAIILAAAGIIRLGQSAAITEYLPFDWWLPAPGQGALAVEVRADDEELIRLLAPLDDYATRAAVESERIIVRALGGGCHTPIGAYGSVHGAELTLSAVVASSDGRHLLRETITGPASDPERVGREAARRLIERGAAALVAATRQCGD